MSSNDDGNVSKMSLLEEVFEQGFAEITRNLLDSLKRFGASSAWSRADDAAKTTVGSILRRWNDGLDEVVRSNPQSLFSAYKNEETLNEVMNETMAVVRPTVSSLCRVLASSLLEGASDAFDVTPDDLDNGVAFERLSRSHRYVAGDVDDDDPSVAASLLAECLRAVKNVSRVCHRLAALHPSADAVRARSTDPTADPTRPLRVAGAAVLYGSLLRAPVAVGVHACHCLFHAAYGAEDAYARAARRAATDAAPDLMRCLADRNATTAFRLPLARIVHRMLGTDFGPSYAAMNAALESIDEEHRGTKKREKEDAPYKLDVQTILVDVLVEIFRTDDEDDKADDTAPPPFPGPPDDRRPEVALEILNVLFVLQPVTSRLANDDVDRATGRPLSDDERRHYRSILTRVGVLLCDLVRLPDADRDERCRRVQLSAVNLLMDAPPDYARYLWSRGAVPPLVALLTTQLDDVDRAETTRKETNARSVPGNAAVKLMPILVVLTRLCSTNAETLRYAQSEVFPNPLADDDDDENETSTTSGKKSLRPADAPKGTLRYRLIRLMTSIDSIVKRCSSELLWTLCNDNANEFVRRTGFGNAVHMLGIKGLMQMPTSD